MAYRSKMSKKSSKSAYKKGARTHVKNVQRPTRGGIRF